MRSWAAKGALGAIVAGVALWPAIGQDAPQSILPPGFEDPAPAPAPAPAPTPPAESLPAAAAPATATGAAPPPADATAPVVASDPMARPAIGKRLDAVGMLSPAAGGYGSATFAHSNGRFLHGLMRRLDTPLAARWGHILLRRALLSEVPAPAGVHPADWVAERAWLLVRMGEVDGAKTLVEAVPLETYTRRMYAVAGQVHLAAGDIPALCPLTPTARTLSQEPFWPLMDAMCAGMEGDDITAATIFDALRDREAAAPFDIALAERIATAVNGGGRAANVEWQDIEKLTVYRYGLATAAGVMPPAELVNAARAPLRAWLFRAPAAPLETRMAMLPTAALLGVSSAAEMVKAYAALGDTLDPYAFDAAPPGRLRAAYVGRPADRLAAMRTLWARGADDGARYTMKLLTARAAALFPINAEHADAAPALVESMLTAGYDRRAVRWWSVAEAKGGAARDQVWPMLAVADASGRVPVTKSRFNDWLAFEKNRIGEGRAQRRGQLLAAALAGLGRGGEDWLDVADDLGSPPLDNLWTRRLAAAAAAGRLGEVVLLAGIGMQASWAGMPPQHLAHILTALRRVGRGAEARMIAAEALARG